LPPMFGAFAGRVFSHALAKPVGLHAHYRVGILIEDRFALKDLHSIESFLIWLISPRKYFLRRRDNRCECAFIKRKKFLA